MRFARRAGRGLFDFKGLRAFKAKLQPSRWDPVYVSFPEETAAPRAIVDVLSAFAHGKFVRFGLATLVRGPTFLVTLLAVLLVPWTCCSRAAMAALVPASARSSGAGWRSTPASPSRCSRCAAAGGRGWPACWSPRSRADAVGTALEAIWWNVPRAPARPPAGCW